MIGTRLVSKKSLRYLTRRDNFTIILALFLMLSVFQMEAKPVGESTARLVAKNFLGQITGRESFRQELVFVNDNAFYVYGFDSGFVIIAADDRSIPVLGYSLEGKFALPEGNDTIVAENFRSWLKFWEDQIHYLVENDISPSSEIILRWQNLFNDAIIRSTTTVVNPMLTTTWGQLWPYNSQCPADSNGSGGHVAAGCGPLAMAQIMKYHNFPSQGLGTYGYTQSPYPYSGANFGATTYQWDSMPNAITSVCNPVATIISHAGISVKAEWSPGGTTSGALTIMMAFVNYFRMAFATLKYVSRYSYSESGWNNLIQNELTSGRPVYYQGFGTNGHAFVCDGVDASGLYHFNWGWNGLYNGYYALNDLTPGPYNFNSGQGAIIGIQPNDGSTLVENTTWSDSVSCQSKIAIPYAVTLTLNPGSTIRFAPGGMLKVWGRLLSLSNPSSYTKVTAINPSDGWEGIDISDDFDRMSENDSTKLVYTQVEYSKSSAIDCNAFGKVVVDHCRINNNYSNPGFQSPGIRVTGKPVIIRNSEIFNNAAGAISIAGTGIFQAQISGNDIHNNTSANGSGIMLSNTRLAITGNTIHHNTATHSGAGLFVAGGLPVIANNRITNNYAVLNGGGSCLEGSNAIMVNNVFTNNTAGDSTSGSGGGLTCSLYASPVMIGNTIANNWSQNGGGLTIGTDCYPFLKNCIIYGNQALAGNQVTLEDNSSDPVFDHCDVQGGTTGFSGWGSGIEYDTVNYTNNIDQLPKFISPSAGAGINFDGMIAGWQLQAESPCIDAGDTSGTGNLIPALDMDGNPRINGIIDMGAYEYYAAIPADLVITDDTIPAGSSSCFNATQTITTGGNGKSFLVQPGGAVTLRAGTTIHLLPGTHVCAGGYLNGLITPDGPWCPEPEFPVSAGVLLSSDQSFAFENEDINTVRVYPNPTHGNLVIDSRGIFGDKVVYFRCYNSRGVCILADEYHGRKRCELSISNQQPGIYLFLIQQGNRQQAIKILKL